MVGYAAQLGEIPVRALSVADQYSKGDEGYLRGDNGVGSWARGEDQNKKVKTKSTQRFSYIVREVVGVLTHLEATV